MRSRTRDGSWSWFWLVGAYQVPIVIIRSNGGVIAPTAFVREGSSIDPITGKFESAGLVGDHNQKGSIHLRVLGLVRISDL